MKTNLLLCTIALVSLIAAPLAAAGTMTLASNGDLYKAWVGDEGLVLTRSGADDTTEEWVVPQTAGVPLSNVQVVLDEPTGSAYLVWQAHQDLDASVRLVHLGRDGLWSGPYLLSGGQGNGTGAMHPTVLRHVAHDTVITDDGATVEVETTFLHVAWWETTYSSDHGIGVLHSIPLDDFGAPMLDAQPAVELSDLLSYGISCSDLPNADMLTYPRLFLDLETNSPHLFVTDFANCVLPILELSYEIEEILDGAEKRRRHIGILHVGSTLAFPPSVPLGQAKLEVGRSLTVAFHWDVDGGVAWILMDPDGWGDTNVLETGVDLSHEQAVELIRKLVR